MTPPHAPPPSAVALGFRRVEAALDDAHRHLLVGRRFQAAATLVHARDAVVAGLAAAQLHHDAPGAVEADARLRELHNRIQEALGHLEARATVQPTKNIRIPFHDRTTNRPFTVLGPASPTAVMRLPSPNDYDYFALDLVISLHPVAPGGLLESVSITSVQEGGGADLLLVPGPHNASAFAQNQEDRPQLIRTAHVAANNHVDLAIRLDGTPVAQVVVVASLQVRIHNDTAPLRRLGVRVPPYLRVPLQVAAADGLNTAGASGIYLTPATPTVNLVSGAIPARDPQFGISDVAVIGLEVASITNVVSTDVGTIGGLAAAGDVPLLGADEVPLDSFTPPSLGPLLRPALRQQAAVDPVNTVRAVLRAYDGLTGTLGPVDTVFVQGVNLLCVPRLDLWNPLV